MLESSQNLLLELLISLNCAGKFYGCFRQDAMVIFIFISLDRKLFDIVIVIGIAIVIFSFLKTFQDKYPDEITILRLLA